MTRESGMRLRRAFDDPAQPGRPISGRRENPGPRCSQHSRFAGGYVPEGKCWHRVVVGLINLSNLVASSRRISAFTDSRCQCNYTRGAVKG